MEENPQQLTNELLHEIEKANEKIQRLESAVNNILVSLHSIGNLVAGKVGATELEILVKQIVSDTLEEQKGVRLGS